MVRRWSKGAKAISDRSGFHGYMRDFIVEPGTGYLIHKDESDGIYNSVDHPLNHVGKYAKFGDPKGIIDASPDVSWVEPIVWSGKGYTSSHALVQVITTKGPNAYGNIGGIATSSVSTSALRPGSATITANASALITNNPGDASITASASVIALTSALRPGVADIIAEASTAGVTTALRSAMTSITSIASTEAFATAGKPAFTSVSGVATSQLNSDFTATGGTITTVTGYTIHTFTSDGTFEVTQGATDAEYLIVGGGGSGGLTVGFTQGGGGGAGEVRVSSVDGNVLVTPGTYAVTVGAGGLSASTLDGSSSSALSVTAVGGGGGAHNASVVNGRSGGSGGGGAGFATSASTGGASTATGYGNAGGNGFASSPTVNRGAGGGGGAGAAGQAAASANSGDGGIGVPSTISGSVVYYGGGGGGAAFTEGNHGLGGTGGGGRGGSDTALPVAGAANTGGGGGGAGDASAQNGGTGGSGVVIIRYRTATGTSTLIDRTTGTVITNFDLRTSAAYDGTTSQAGAACTFKNNAINNSGYSGKTLSSASAIHKVVVYGSNDFGYVQAFNASTTLTLYGKNGAAPASGTDGTALGVTTFTDTLNESTGRTIVSSDLTTAWDHVWVNLTQTNNANLAIAEIEMYAWV